MLTKLIKYDLKFILKSVSIYIIILLICAMLFNLTSYDYPTCQIIDDVTVCEDNASIILQIAHTIFWNAIFAIIIGLILNAIIRTWARFKINFFHDEAYLTHTLPIKRKTLWAAKFISAIIIVAIVILAIAASLAILQLTESGKMLTYSFGIGAPMLTPLFYCIYIFTVITQLLYMAICGFTGIIIGNRMNARNNLRALLWGIGIYLIGVFIMLGCFLVWSAFDGSIHAMLFSGASSQTVLELTGVGFMEKTLTGVSIIYTIMIATLYFTDQHLLGRGINID